MRGREAPGTDRDVVGTTAIPQVAEAPNTPPYSFRHASPLLDALHVGISFLWHLLADHACRELAQVLGHLCRIGIGIKVRVRVRVRANVRVDERRAQAVCSDGRCATSSPSSYVMR